MPPAVSTWQRLNRVRGRALAFALTWTSYATYYLGRKGYSVARVRIVSEFGARSLHGVETAYLAAYALGQYASGALGDRYGARRLIGYGMLLSAVACAAFGAASASAVFIAAFVVNGLAQSTGWPGNIKAMAEWTTPENRGAVMGVWATCYQVGGIVATAAAARLLRFGWRAAFFGPALCIGAMGVVILLFLRAPGDEARGVARADPAAESHPQGASPARDEGELAVAARRKVARRAVIGSSTVWCYGAAYFCIKLIRYSILFWLPFYLTTALGYPEERAGYLSTSFEIGGIVGTIALGLASDRFRGVSRSVWSAGSLVMLAIALFAYARLGATSELANFVIMALVGALLFGPDALISGAAAQDAGGPDAAALAAGVVNGIGSMGAILQETVTVGVSARFGWGTLFYVFLGLALLGALALAPTFKRRRTGEQGAKAEPD